MSLLTEQEIFECLPDNGDSLAFARAIEAKVIEKIKAERPFCFTYLDSYGEPCFTHPDNHHPKDAIALYRLHEGD